MEKKLNRMLNLWKEEHVLYLGISFGVALFVVSFQPFSSQHLEFQQTFLTAIIIGGIVFCTIFLVRAVCLILREGKTRTKKVATIDFEASGFIIWFLSSIVCMLYIVYIDSENISFYILFKVTLICLAPPLMLKYSGKMHDLKRNNELLSIQGNLLRYKQDGMQNDGKKQSVEFKSKNGSGNFSLFIEDILFVKSADNYTEIHYLEGTHYKMKLLRNTLKNIESEIKKYPQIVRCHRTCIINIENVAEFNTNCSTHNLTLKGSDQLIPVSRQYVSKIKQALQH